MSYYVIRQGPFPGRGPYFCGLLDGDEMWSSRRARALRFREQDRDHVEVAVIGLSTEARVVRIRTKGERTT